MIRALAPSITSVTDVAAFADAALLTEVMLTPKPGLVDRRNSGAHRDMNLQTFLASARAIAPWWPRFVETGYNSCDLPIHAVLPLVRSVGVRCEDAMIHATEGVNTHKGAIFSIGLLCAAAGRLTGRAIELTRDRLCVEVARICLGIVERELDSVIAPRTAGERMFKQYRFAGARGETASGFLLTRSTALPLYERLRIAGVGADRALLHALLHLLAVNRDTNVVSRGGLAGLIYVQNYARRLLDSGGALANDAVDKLAEFDDALIARNLSPGGSADLLAVTWFLAQFGTRLSTRVGG